MAGQHKSKDLRKPEGDLEPQNDPDTFTTTSDGEAPASPAVLGTTSVAMTKQLATAENLPGPPTLVAFQQVWGKHSTTASNLARVVLPFDRAETTANVRSCFVFRCQLNSLIP